MNLKGLKDAVPWPDLLLVILFSCFIISVLTKPVSQDEGVFLAIGKYLNTGLLPYRDFFDHKPPGIYLLLSLLFNIFSPNLWLAKLLLILATLASTVLIIKISQNLQPNSTPFSAIFFLTLLIFFEGNHIIAEPFLALFLVSSCYLLIKPDNSWRHLFLSGALAAGALLMKQTAILSAIALLIFLLRCFNWRNFLWFIGGFFIPLVLTALYFAKHSLFNQALYQIITVNFFAYPKENFWSVVRSLSGIFLLTLPIWLLFFSGVFRFVKKNNLILSLAIIPIPLLFFRHYPHYWVQIIPFVAIITGMMFSYLLPLKQLPLFIMLFVLATVSLKITKETPNNLASLEEQLVVASYLNNHAQKILLAENQFSAYYFLLNKKPLNKFLYITEVNDLRDQAQKKTIEELPETRDLIILWPKDPNYAYAKELQDFITKNYQKINNSQTLGLSIYAE